MPTLGSHLNFAQLEARSMRVHQLSAAPASPVTGQLYYDTTANALYWWNGTAWISASGGTPPDATASTKGVVQLAGDLTGTAAAPAVATGAITSAKILDGTITDVDVAAANKDGVVGTASLRTLGAGAQQAMPGNRTLDAITAPAADLNLNSHKIINQLDPTSPQDGATKNYVDGLIQGLAWKQPVRVVSTGNIAGGGPIGGAQTIDGIALASGDRVLVVGQSTPANNGIFTCNTGSTWGRAFDADVGSELLNAAVFVEQGTTYADTAWVCTTDPPITPGTTGLTFVQWSGAAQITAGNGLTKTGNTLAVGAGTGITVGPGVTSIDSTIIPRYYSSATHAAGTTWTITQATHGCRAAQGLHVQVQDATSGNIELPDVSVSGTGDVTITYAASVAANSKRVTIVG
jgi:hypothetical protein